MDKLMEERHVLDFLIKLLCYRYLLFRLGDQSMFFLLLLMYVTGIIDSDSPSEEMKEMWELGMAFSTETIYTLLELSVRLWFMNRILPYFGVILCESISRLLQCMQFFSKSCIKLYN